MHCSFETYTAFAEPVNQTTISALANLLKVVELAGGTSVAVAVGVAVAVAARKKHNKMTPPLIKSTEFKIHMQKDKHPERHIPRMTSSNKDKPHTKITISNKDKQPYIHGA